MKCLWFGMGILVFLQMSSALAMSLSGDDPVKVNFCCLEGEILRLRNVRDHHQAKCVRRKGLKNNLEGLEVPFVNETLNGENNQTEFVIRKLSKLEIMKPKCKRGLQISKVDFNKTVSVDLSGNLLRMEDVVDTKQYCLAENWETTGSESNGRDSLASFDGTVALSCDQCMEEVLCYYLRELFESLFSRGKAIRRDDYFSNNIVNVGDKNGDDEVNFEEFKSKIVEYLTIAFNILDRNDDGSIDEVLSNESIKEYSLEFIEQLLNNVVEYLDTDGDESISTEDFNLLFHGQNVNIDGKVPISKVIGHSLINLPAPIYTLYTLLDEDQDEIFTKEEMLGFIRRTFTIIDKNGDCYINLKEIIVALDESNLPEDFQLGMKLVGHQYLTLAKYMVDGIIAKADKNEDSKVTLDEIVKFSDFSFIDSIDLVIRMGYPTSAAEYLIGTYRDAGQRALVVWLTTLNTFIDNPVYKSEPSTKCGLAVQ